MRKIILGFVATAAIAAPLTAATAASADTVTTVTGATFTLNQPKDTVAQWGNVWKHVYTVTVQPNGNFTGNGQITDNDSPAVAWTEDIKGQFTDSDDADSVFDHVTFNTVPNAGSKFSVRNAPMDRTTVDVESDWAANAIQFQIAQPVFQTVTTSTTPTCTPSAAVAKVEHTEYQWAALVAKPKLHWEYKYTASAKNPSTDLAHIWVKSLDLTKKNWPQVTKNVVDVEAKDAVVCESSSGDVAWDYNHQVKGTLKFNADANGGTVAYENDRPEFLNGTVTPGSYKQVGNRVEFSGTFTHASEHFKADGNDFIVVVTDNGASGDTVAMFVNEEAYDVHADVTNGDVIINGGNLVVS